MENLNISSEGISSDNASGHVDDGEKIDECSNDSLIAKMLQLEFNKEHNSLLKQEESKYNSSRKIKISFKNYLCSKTSTSSDDDPGDNCIQENDQNHLNEYDNAEKAVGNSEVTHQGNTAITNHDTTVSDRNTEKMMELPPNIHTGDGSRLDTEISNNVYTALKTRSLQEHKRSR